MSELLHPTGAVFLSYGSQDAEAAERICEALRAAGVEAWLDKSELRGGDSWDAQIKKQIHDCALFLPVISAHTNARTEGYFRREWNLATRRLLDMAHDAPFLVPVVVDDTREVDARVPEEFLRAQWTWLRDGETPPAFAHRVRQLLGEESASGRDSHSGAGKIEPSAQSAFPVQPRLGLFGYRDKRRVLGIGLALIALLLVLGTGAFWYYIGTSDSSATKPAPATDAVSAAVSAQIANASIAVLPFVNMSSDPEQEYFSDGMSEQILNLLSKIPKLRVIARTSSFAFKGENIEIAEIAKKLNVAHVLEGSVRKSGNKLRVTVQLINSSDSSRQWSETYDRELADIFAVQDEIALAVVHEIKPALLGNDLPERSRTTSLDAYNLYLMGQHLVDLGTEESQAKAVKFFRRALEADPRYGEAWAALANVQAMLAIQGFKDAALGFAEARATAQKALDLDPKLASAHFALGLIQYYHDWDWLAADTSFKKAIAFDPNDSWALANAGSLAQTLGKREVGRNLSKQAVALDPIAVLTRIGLTLSYFHAGQLDEAEREIRTILELSPEFAGGRNLLGTILLLKGQSAPALEIILKEPVEFWRLAGLSLAYHAGGQKQKSDAVLREFIEKYASVSAFQIAEAYAYRGEKQEAFEWLDRAYRQRDAGLISLNADPLFENIKSDPRFAAMLRKLKLPELPRN